MSSRVRTRPDLCPGVARPWPAEDGGLVRLRLVGGRVAAGQLAALASVATAHGDGRVHLTARANLQLRGLPLVDGALPAEVVAALHGTGLVPAPAHELVRNVMVSPLTGLAGGRADLRPVAAALDAALVADPALAALPARFLLVLDDGRGDLLDRPADVRLVAVDAEHAQVGWGEDRWGPVLPLAAAPEALLAVARAFLTARPAGDDAPWHVAELEEAAGPLDVPGLPAAPRDARLPAPGGPTAAPLPAGPVAGVRELEHVVAPDGLLADDQLARLAALPAATALVVTPWRGVLAPPAVPAPPTRRYPYEGDGQAIYVDSFATIRAEGRFDHLPADAEKVAVRMVHGTGQVDLAPSIVVSDDLVAAARTALESGAPIITDAHMVASGVTRARLPRDNEVLCALRAPGVADLARAWGTTRSAAALSLLADRIGGSVVAIGNAPTALFHLLEMLQDGCPPPAAVVGCPVGFIGAAESKEALETYARRTGLPFLTVHGRRGGSAMTASALNALAQERE